MKETGLTLIELITVLAIAAILSMVAAPTFVSLVAGQKLKAAASDLQIALMVARSESLKRNADVRLSPATGDQWNTGWRVASVADNSLIAAYPAAPAITITGPAMVTYRPSGRLTATAVQPFRLSCEQIAQIRCITISSSGMPAVTSSGC